MARKKLIRQNAFPYHVYIRSNNRDWFQLPLNRMWDLCIECFQYGLEHAHVRIHSFVLMKNHYHVLLTTPNCDLDKFMRAFNRKLSQRINKEAGVINHKFANGYKWTIVDSRSYLFNIYRYIYQNPVRAGLCRLCVDYPYTSLRMTPAQVRKLQIKPHLDYFEHQCWMEKRHGAEFDKAIKKGLKKRTFTLANAERIFIHQVLKEIPG